MSTLNKQVGGDHYKNLKYPPLHVCNAVGDVYGFMVGSIAKYLCRFPFKGNPSEDLKKALHYIELHRVHSQKPTALTIQSLKRIGVNTEAFIRDNEVTDDHAHLLRAMVTAVTSGDYKGLSAEIERIVKVLDQQNEYVDKVCGVGNPPSEPVLSSINPTVDFSKYDLSVGHMVNKIARDLAREHDKAAEDLIKKGYTDIQSSAQYNGDGTVSIKVWGTKLK